MAPVLRVLGVAAAYLTSLATAETYASAELSARQGPDFTPPQLLQVVFNASELFGWQLAGRAIKTQEIADLCNNTQAVGHGKWAPIGLSPLYIAEPSCDLGSARLPESQVIHNDAVVSNTNIFITQILNAFNQSNMIDDLTYICKNIKGNRLTPFGINTGHFLEVICGAGRARVPSAPNNTPCQLSQAQLSDFKTTISDIFAYELATSSATADQAANLCKSAPRYAQRLSAQGLDAGDVQKVLCSVKQPLSNNEASAAISKYSTSAFIQTVVGASDVPGWTSWLCENLDLQHLNAVALNGTVVLQQICAPDAGRPGRCA
nr:hypothetical protein B0A51_14852 [Rachicladosporium sp. CCFEE 5018]